MMNETASRDIRGSEHRSRLSEQRAPAISVVIASAGSRADLQRSLGVVSGLRGALHEVIVVRREPMSGEMRALMSAGDIAYVQAPPSVCAEELREIGVSHARGQITLIRSDHEIRDILWITDLLPSLSGSDREAALPLSLEPHDIDLAVSERVVATAT